MKYTPYSHSRIETFFSCPLKFKLTYLEKIRPNVETSPALLKGSYFHHLVEQYSEEKKPNPDFDIPEDLKNETEKLFEKSLEGVVGKYLKGDEFVTVGTEVAFGLDGKFIPCNYYSKKVLLRGFIDKIVKKGNDYYILDWKTNAKKPDYQQQKYNQLELYALWMFRMFPEIEKLFVSYVYPVANDENVLEISRARMRQLAENLSKKIREIETCDNFIKKESPLCDWCDFRKAGFCC